MLGADGVYRWRRNCGRVERAGGNVVRVVGALLDIDDERRLLEELREGADRMALAEDVAGFGIWRLDLPTNVMSLSPGAAYLSGLGRRRSTFRGRCCRSGFTPTIAVSSSRRRSGPSPAPKTTRPTSAFVSRTAAYAGCAARAASIARTASRAA